MISVWGASLGCWLPPKLEDYMPRQDIAEHDDNCGD